MRKDTKTLYRIETNATIEDTKTEGFTTYGGTINGMDIIDIRIKVDLSTIRGTAQLAHELKHAFQFYNGEMIFAFDIKTNKVVVNSCKPMERESIQRHKAYAPIIVNTDYLDNISDSRISLDQMKNQYPNYEYIYRKK